MMKCVDWGLVKKYWGAGPEQRRVGGSSVLEPLVGRGCSIFSYPCSNSFQCQRTNNTPFYSCRISDLVSEWQRGWS